MDQETNDRRLKSFLQVEYRLGVLEKTLSWLFENNAGVKTPDDMDREKIKQGVLSEIKGRHDKPAAQ